MLKEKQKKFGGSKNLGIGTRIVFNISPDAKEGLEKEALEKGMNVSVLLRIIIDKHLQK